MPLPRLGIVRFLLRSRSRKRDRILTGYAKLLEQQFPYYFKMRENDRMVFLRRLHQFRRSKKFQHVGFDKSLETEVLVSAAAIQLTFGLNKYRMGFFRDIYIMKDAYTYGLSTVPWAGHVNRKGIYFSWKHFQHGYEVSNDRYNVGLHEMAHALEYEFSMGDYAHDDVLQARFQSVMRMVNGVIFHEQWRRTSVFTNEGISNVHECWAESVELFFENPVELKNYYPDLYQGIKLLLNQDPLASSNG